MPRIELLNISKIESDIIHSNTEPKEMSEKSYKRMTVTCAILACFLIVISFFKPKLVLYILLLLIAACVVAAAVELLRLQRKIRASIEDYDITNEVLSDKVEEEYRQRYGHGHFRRSRSVNNYTLRFENGKSWRISHNNYVWAESGGMSDLYIYDNAHRGDLFTVVTNKKTGNIVMAYDSKFFEYRD